MHLPRTRDVANVLERVSRNGCHTRYAMVFSIRIQDFDTQIGEHLINATLVGYDFLFQP